MKRGERERFWSFIEGPSKNFNCSVYCPGYSAAVGFSFTSFTVFETSCSSVMKSFFVSSVALVHGV